MVVLNFSGCAAFTHCPQMPGVTVDDAARTSVDAADQAAIQALVGTTDPTADFDCDGQVTAADMTIVGQHLGHVCPRVTPARPSSWGEVKLIYR